jgi:tetratricopeptide (TPR) repeat protein
MRTLIVLLLLSWARLAVAAPADDLRASGLRAYAVGRYDQAIEAFQQAYQLDPTPDLLYALAQAQRMKGDCRAAAVSYRAYLRTGPSERSAAPARQNLERCEQELAKPAPPTKPTVEVVAPPPPVEPAVPPRRWQSDRAAAVLMGLGGAALVAGAVSWGVGEAGAQSLAAASSYDQFATRAADADAYDRERIGGIVSVAVGGVLAAVAVGRWVYVARHR